MVTGNLWAWELTMSRVTGPAGKRRILIIDDDDLSRGVMTLVFDGEGYRVVAAASGDEAVELKDSGPFHVILMDMQMPGLSGDALAVRLREVFGGGPRLIGMSGSEVKREAVLRFDGFLLKPFGASDLERLLVGTVGVKQGGPAQSPVLDEAVHIKLHRSMKPEQVNEMYAFCISDAMRRAEQMEEMAANGDDVGFRREAHTIKGGCAMLGALELRDLAARLESSGIPRDAGEKNQLRHQFVVACERLERILKARLRKNRA